jgi:hypothetical protein
MRGFSVACVVSLAVACGGRSSHEVFGLVSVDAGGDDVVDASGSDVADAADAGSDVAVPLEAGTCTSGNSSGALSGNIAGVPTTLNLFGSSSATGVPIVQASWSVLRASSPDEVLLAWGTGGPDGGPQQGAGALIVVPKPGLGSTFYCAASVAANSSPADMGHAASIALTDLSVLGECPGTPVNGDVDICLEGSDAGAGCTEDFGVSGTVDGTDVRFRNLGGALSTADVGGDFHASVTGDGGDGGVILFANAQDGKLRGWLRLPDNASSNAGSVFCLSSAFVVGQPNGGYSVTFQSVGRLGSCPGTPIGGELGYCDRFD